MWHSRLSSSHWRPCSVPAPSCSLFSAHPVSGGHWHAGPRRIYSLIEWLQPPNSTTGYTDTGFHPQTCHMDSRYKRMREMMQSGMKIQTKTWADIPSNTDSRNQGAHSTLHQLWNQRSLSERFPQRLTEHFQYSVGEEQQRWENKGALYGADLDWSGCEDWISEVGWVQTPSTLSVAEGNGLHSLCLWWVLCAHPPTHPDTHFQHNLPINKTGGIKYTRRFGALLHELLKAWWWFHSEPIPHAILCQKKLQPGLLRVYFPEQTCPVTSHHCCYGLVHLLSDKVVHSDQSFSQNLLWVFNDLFVTVTADEPTLSTV